MKQLILMRHATADKTVLRDDLEHELTEHGQKEAGQAAEFLSAFSIDRIITSHSKRTQQTMEIILSKIQIDHQIYEDIYHGEATDIIELISNQPNEVKSLMVLGHNPCIHELAIEFIDRQSEGYRNIVGLTFPPATIVVINLLSVTDWTDILNTDIFGEMTHLFLPQINRPND